MFWGVYINFEIVSVGYIREILLVDKEVVIGIFNFNGNGKLFVYGEIDGFIEVICDKKIDDLLGVFMIGLYVMDLIVEVSIVMYLDVVFIEIGEVIYVYLIMIEVL